MAKGELVWCDLSAWRLEDAKAFYAGLFGWTYHRLKQPDGSAYDVASTAAGETAALFDMPAKFRELKLPSFWMPYFGVDDVETACAIATEHGGRVEVPPLAWSSTDKIALIRDTLGAGFTVHQGTGLAGAGAVQCHGHRVGCALYVSNVDAVRDFYEALLGWSVASETNASGGYPVRSVAGTTVTTMHELDDARRGRYEFWGLNFAVTNVAAAIEAVESRGGTIVEEDRSTGERVVLARDPDDAAFFMPSVPEPAGGRVGTAADGGRVGKWKTVLGLAILYVAVLFEQNWVWGLLFLLWTVPALRSGETFFVETIGRRSNPVLFWLVIITWLALSSYLIFTDLLRLAGPP